jgi:ribosomal protein S18 acetylase RimI-like enzyme
MADAVTIRLARVADAAAIHDAILALAEATGSAGKVTASVADIAAHGFGPSPAFEALIAEADGLLAGLCLTFPSFSTWRGERGLYVQDLYVAAPFRGKGLGERLLQAAARRGTAQGAGYMRLSVDVQNLRGQAFYRRLGIAHAGDEQIHMIKGAAFATLASSGQDLP